MLAGVQIKHMDSGAARSSKAGQCASDRGCVAGACLHHHVALRPGVRGIEFELQDMVICAHIEDASVSDVVYKGGQRAVGFSHSGTRESGEILLLPGACGREREMDHMTIGIDRKSVV